MELAVHPVRSHFLDSGAFSLRRKSKGEVDYVEYMNRYVEFVRTHSEAIDYYANVDVIGDSQKTWEHQQYLEDRGLRPVPVVHFGADLKWLEHYIDRGYEFIALGGLVGKTAGSHGWLNRCFDLVCSTPNRLPVVKLHGFGIVNYSILIKYPWWSVDSAAWIKEAGRWAAIFVPHQRRGEFVFTEHPYKILMGEKAVEGSNPPHYLSLATAERKIVHDWLELNGFPIGQLKVQTDRAAINLWFFERMRKSLPRWPWAFPPQRETRARVYKEVEFGSSRLRVYYSGGNGSKPLPSDPEVALGSKACIMMTFFEMPNKRFDRVLDARQKGTAVTFESDG